MSKYRKGQIWSSPNGKEKIEILSDPNKFGQISFKETNHGVEAVFYSRPEDFVDLTIEMHDMILKEVQR